MITSNPRTSDNSLNAISCIGTSSCEAVGFRSDGDVQQPLAEYWNGTMWSRQSIPSPPSGVLSAVSCISASRCEAVGVNDVSDATLALGWNGSTWIQQKTPKIAEPTSGLRSVSCYADGCTAIGYGYNAGNANGENAQASVVFAYNGTKWTVQSPLGSADPTAAFGTFLEGIHCVKSSKCTAAGSWLTPAPPGYAGYNFYSLVTTWNGSSWTVNSTPNPFVDSYGIYADPLYAISCPSGQSVCTAGGVPVMTNG
jgi:hypothetical protein